ncbi:MAG TPA: ABC transporter permease [Candidatus Nanoarchaeia archaeon]|nr:ABC transporter permease [Candidatus Nanoarchaeia archaeon]
MKLFSIIQKNFKIFIRSKVSALIIFLGPLLLVSLVGISFSNTALPGLTVGTYAPAYNEFTNSILSKIKDNNFVINQFDSRDLCSDAVKRGDISICLVFPENMDSTNNEVSFVVDYSKINLVWIVVDIFSNKVSERATELRYSYANNLITKVVQTQEDLTKGKANIDAITAKQSESTNILSSAQEGLEDITPNTDLGQTLTAADAKTSINVIVSKIEDAQDELDAAAEDVDGSSMSDTEKNAVKDGIDGANSALSNALTYLEGNSSVNSLGRIIEDIQQALDNAQSQLATIKKKKDAVKGELITLQGGIADATKSVEDLKALTTAMIARIESVQSGDAQQLVSPIRTKIEPVSTQETHFNYLFPTLIALVIMITAVLLSSTLVMHEKKSKSVFRNFITPTSDFIFNAGTFLTAFLAIAAQVIIFLFVSFLFFETDVLSNIIPSIFVLALITSTFIALGMLVGYFFRSEETYVLASITVCTVLLFLSSTIMPLESISDSVRTIAAFTPFVVSETVLRQIMFFDFDLISVWPQLLILIGYTLAFFAGIFVIQKLFRWTLNVKKKEEKKQ